MSLRATPSLLPLLALGLVGLTVVFGGQGAPPPVVAPAVPVVAEPTTDARPVIELVFAIDTTGSMSGLLEGAKAKVWSIVDQFASGEPRPDIRVGIVAYRDHQDDYLTQIVPLTDDLDGVWASLLALDASGGGDAPEAVNTALHQAVTAMQWTPRAQVYRAIFLVGDAPPHREHPQELPYASSVEAARRRGISVHAVQCGADLSTREHFQAIALAGGGAWLSIAQDGGMARQETPIDAELAALQRDLAATALPWGSAQEQAKLNDKLARALGADVEQAAARGSYLAREGGRVNSGRKDLVAAVIDGEVAVAEVAEEALPEALRGLSPEAREAAVAARVAQRRALQAEVEALVETRDRWLAEAGSGGGSADGFDARVKAEVIERVEALGYVDY